jgi:hypothetical protein
MHGNDLWALAVVEEVPVEQIEDHNAAVHELLQLY